MLRSKNVPFTDHESHGDVDTRVHSHGDVDTRVHIYTATALGRDRVSSPTLDRLYTRGKPPVLIS